MKSADVFNLISLSHELFLNCSVFNMTSGQSEFSFNKISCDRFFSAFYYREPTAYTMDKWLLRNATNRTQRNCFVCNNSFYLSYFAVIMDFRQRKICGDSYFLGMIAMELLNLKCRKVIISDQQITEKLQRKVILTKG